MNRTGDVLDRADGIEPARARIVDVEVAQHLQQAERQHDRSRQTLLVDHLGCEVRAAGGAAERDPPRVEFPALSGGARAGDAKKAKAAKNAEKNAKQTADRKSTR